LDPPQPLNRLNPYYLLNDQPCAIESKCPLNPRQRHDQLYSIYSKYPLDRLNLFYLLSDHLYSIESKCPLNPPQPWSRR